MNYGVTCGVLFMAPTEERNEFRPYELWRHLRCSFYLRRLKSGMNSAPMNYGVTCGVLFMAPTEERNEFRPFELWRHLRCSFYLRRLKSAFF
jgi:hypothetical protein